MTLKKEKQSVRNPELADLPPLPMDVPGLIHDFMHHYSHHLGRDKYCRFGRYQYQALAFTIRERIIERWNKTRYAYMNTGCKTGYYLSLEFLMGRALGNAMLNLGMTDSATQAMQQIGMTLEELAE